MKRDKLEFERYSASYQLWYPWAHVLTSNLQNPYEKYTFGCDNETYWWIRKCQLYIIDTGRCSINDIFPVLQILIEYYLVSKFHFPLLMIHLLYSFQQKYFKAFLYINNFLSRTFLSLCLILKFVAELKRHAFRIAKKNPSSVIEP